MAAVLANSDDDLAPWVNDPSAWIRQRLSLPDWYEDLDVGEPTCWEAAICSLLELPEFDLQPIPGSFVEAPLSLRPS